MTTDLICLVINALWGVALVQIEVTGKTRAAGAEWNVGNRDGKEPEFPDFVKRAGRALANHKEAFPLFLTAVVVVHLAGKADKWSAIGSIVFVVGRAAHGILYIAGITHVRSLAFLAAFGGCLLVLSRLVFG